MAREGSRKGSFIHADARRASLAENPTANPEEFHRVLCKCGSGAWRERMRTSIWRHRISGNVHITPLGVEFYCSNCGYVLESGYAENWKPKPELAIVPASEEKGGGGE